MPPDDLYERDFFLWTKAQAEALRARGRGSNQIDYDTLAEEVEDMGRAERNKAESLTLRIIQHLYYLTASSRTEPRGGWRAEIRIFRHDLSKALTPTIRRYIETELASLHGRGFAAAKDGLESYEPGVAPDAALRWTLEQILGEADDPLA